MPKFKINKFLTLKLESGHTFIYINDEKFEFYCKKLFVSIQIDKIADFDNVKSIDDLNSQIFEPFSITPETEFWGHCSNIQAWAENNYNTLILHSNIAFPLLKKLTEVGDPIANKIFKDEIAERFLSENLNTSLFLAKEHFLTVLNDEEFFTLIRIYRDFAKRTKIEKIDVYKVLGLSHFSKGCNHSKKKDFAKSKEFFQKAKKFFEKVLKMDSKKWDIWFELAEVIFELGNYEEAIEKYQKAIESNPEYELAWNNYGYTLNKLGNYEKAIEKFQRAIEINPSEGWGNYGYALTKLGKHSQAIEKFQRAIEINPSDDKAWGNYGIALIKLGKHSQAIEKFRKSIEINPKSKSTWNLVAVLIKMLQEYEYDDWVDLTVAEFIETFLAFLDFSRDEFAITSGFGDSINDDWIQEFEKIWRYNDLDREISNQSIVDFLNLEINYCPECDNLLNPIYKYCFICVGDLF